VIVLVNHFSASASEIFAGAIQDNHRGVIISPKGENTYGKASVQTISPLRHSLDKDDFGNYKSSGLRLTTAHYYTPAGTLIHEKGIKADIEVPLPEGHERALRENGLLGDPSRIEPGGEDAATTQTATVNPADPAVAQEEKPEDGSGLVKMLQGGVAQSTEDSDAFSDVVLDEAMKYLRAILIMELSRRTAA
jgi:carboxyl-terminal processing protease